MFKSVKFRTLTINENIRSNFKGIMYDSGETMIEEQTLDYQVGLECEEGQLVQCIND